MYIEVEVGKKKDSLGQILSLMMVEVVDHSPTLFSVMTMVHSYIHSLGGYSHPEFTR